MKWEATETINELQVVTRNNSSKFGKSRVYFTCLPEDMEKSFQFICNDIFEMQDCAIFYTENMNSGYSDMDGLLQNMNLFVVPITNALLESESRTLLVDIPYAIKEGKPILPLMLEPNLSEKFEKKVGKLQYLNPAEKDSTCIAYKEKLKKYLNSVLVSDEQKKKIQDAFDAYIFLSYRKKDRKDATKLIHLIHENNECRDIAIWYDELLTPGEAYDKEIITFLEKSDLFALLVTQNLLEDGNYVMKHEYPDARSMNKTILPVEMQETDKNKLQEMYEHIPECIKGENAEELKTKIIESLGNIAFLENDKNPAHNYLIGLAYLEGIDVEMDHKRAVELISEAASANLPEAVEKLAYMYRDGNGVERDWNKYLEWLQKDVEICSSMKDFRKEELIDKKINLAETYFRLKKLYRAEEILNQLYESLDENQESEMMSLIRVLNLRASVLLEEGCRTDAVSDKKKAIEYLKSFVQENDKEKMLLLAEMLHDTGCSFGTNKDNRYNCLKEAYEIRKKWLGDSVDTLITKNALMRYDDPIKIMKEEENGYRDNIYDEIYKKCVKEYGEDHPITLHYLHETATVEADPLRFIFSFRGDSALEKLDFVYKKQTQILGKDHPDTLRTRLSYAEQLMEACREKDKGVIYTLDFLNPDDDKKYEQCTEARLLFYGGISNNNEKRKWGAAGDLYDGMEESKQKKKSRYIEPLLEIVDGLFDINKERYGSDLSKMKELAEDLGEIMRGIKDYEQSAFYYEQAYYFEKKRSNGEYSFSMALNKAAFYSIEAHNYKHAIELYGLFNLDEEKKKKPDRDANIKKEKDFRSHNVFEDRFMRIGQDGYFELSNNIAYCYAKLQEYDKAIAIYERLYEELKDDTDCESISRYRIMIVLLALTICYHDLGKNDKAIEYSLKSLEECKKRNVSDDCALYIKPDIYLVLNHSYSQKGLDYSNCINDLVNKAYFIRKNACNRMDYSVLYVLYEELYDLLEDKLGENHDKTVTIRCHIAECYMRVGRTVEAQRIYESLQKEQSIIRKEDDPILLSIIHNSAIMHNKEYWRWEDRVFNSERHFDKVYQIRRDTLGEAHPLTRLSLAGLIFAYERQLPSSEAKERLSELNHIQDEIIKKYGEKDLLSSEYMKEEPEWQIYNWEPLDKRYENSLKTSLYGMDSEVYMLTLYSCEKECFKEVALLYDIEQVILSIYSKDLPALEERKRGFSQKFRKYFAEFNYKTIEKKYYKIKESHTETDWETLEALFDYAGVLAHGTGCPSNPIKAYSLYTSALTDAIKIEAKEDADGNKNFYGSNECSKKRKEIIKQYFHDDDVFQQLSEIDKKEFGDNSAYYYAELGDVIFDSGEEKHKILKQLEEIYEIQKEKYGQKNTQIIKTLNNIVAICYELEDYEKSLKYAEITYDIKKEMLGEIDEKTVESLRDKAFSYYKLKDNIKALETYEKVYESSVILYKDSEKVLRSLQECATINSNLGNYERAIELRKKEIEMRDHALYNSDIPGHEGRHKARAALAEEYTSIGDYNTALKIYCEEYTLYGEQKKRNDMYEAIAVSLYKEKHHIPIDDSEDTKQSSIDSSEERINSSDQWRCLRKIAYMKWLLEDYEGAISDYEAVYQYYMERFNGGRARDDEDSLSYKTYISNSYYYLGQYDKALEVDDYIYKQKKRIFGDKDPKTLLALHNIAFTYSKVGRNEEAINAAKEAFEGRKELFGLNSSEALQTYVALALFYHENGDDKQAVSICEEVTEFLKKDNSILPQRSLERMITVYEANNMHESAEMIRKIGKMDE